MFSSDRNACLDWRKRWYSSIEEWTSYPGWKLVTSVPVPSRGTAIDEPLALIDTNREASVITVRCDPGDRSQISVSEKVRAFVPLKYWVCHIDGEIVLSDDSELGGKFRGKLLVGCAGGVVAVEGPGNIEACETSSNFEVLLRYSSK